MLFRSCGSGVPIAQILSRSFRVVGVDLAAAQIRFARSWVPPAELTVGDMAHLPFREGCFDGVCSYYAIIHVPREEHRSLVRGIHRVLKPSGVGLLCMGQEDLPGQVGEYMGTPMFWSHYDGKVNERIVRESGFEILWARAVIDAASPGTSHRFFLVRKR